MEAGRTSLTIPHCSFFLTSLFCFDDYSNHYFYFDQASLLFKLLYTPSVASVLHASHLSNHLSHLSPAFSHLLCSFTPLSDYYIYLTPVLFQPSLLPTTSQLLIHPQLLIQSQLVPLSQHKIIYTTSLLSYLYTFQSTHPSISHGFGSAVAWYGKLPSRSGSLPHCARRTATRWIHARDGALSLHATHFSVSERRRIPSYHTFGAEAIPRWCKLSPQKRTDFAMDATSATTTPSDATSDCL